MKTVIIKQNYLESQGGEDVWIWKLVKSKYSNPEIQYNITPQI